MIGLKYALHFAAVNLVGDDGEVFHLRSPCALTLFFYAGYFFHARVHASGLMDYQIDGGGLGCGAPKESRSEIVQKSKGDE